MYLNDGVSNNNYEVIKINLDARTKKRLQDMGITQKGIIKVMSVVDSHVSVYKIRGSRVGLSEEITSKIEVIEKV